MKIININWESEKDKEASVVLSDNRHEIEVFSHPCLVKQGDEIYYPLIPLNTYSLEIINTSSLEEIVKDSRKFHYTIVATVKNIKKGTVSVGNLLFDVSPLPGDVNIGDKVKFFTDRVDL